MEKTKIYVEIIEGSAEPVFTEVPALYLGKRFYKIAEHSREDYDTLRFNTGTYVVCLVTQFQPSEDLVPVAYCEISQEAVEYILDIEQAKS